MRPPILLALAALIAACSSPPSNPDAVMSPAESETGADTAAEPDAAILRGSLDRAASVAQSILDRDSANISALKTLAEVRAHQRRREESAELYGRLYASTGGLQWLEARFGLLQAAGNAGPTGIAAEQYIRDGGDSPAVRLWLVLHLAAEQKQAQAALMAKNLPDHLPFASRDDRDALNRLWVDWARNRTRTESADAYRRALRYGQLELEEAEEAARVFLDVGDPARARDVLRGVEPPDTDSLLLRAGIAAAMSDSAQARAFRLRYFESGGRDPAVLTGLLAELGSGPGAMRVGEALWSMNLPPARRLELAGRLAAQHRSAGDTESEIRVLAQVRAAASPGMLDRLGLLYERSLAWRDAFDVLNARHAGRWPDDQADRGVSLAIRAGESDQALRIARATDSRRISEANRRTLASHLGALAEQAGEDADERRAEQNLRDAVKLHPDADVFFKLASLNIRRDRAQATAGLLAALKLNPKHGPANAMLGALLLDESKPREALPYLEAAARSGYDSTDLQLNLGRACASTAPSRAHEYLLEYLRRAGDGPLDVSVIELLARTAPQSADAIRWWTRRMESDFSRELAGEILDALRKQPDEVSAASAASILERHPGSVDLLNKAGAIYQLAGDSDRLLAVLSRHLALDPPNSERLKLERRLFDLYAGLGRDDEARALLPNLLESYKEDAALMLKGYELLRGTDREAPLLARMAKSFPDDPRIQSAYAAHQFASGRPELALAAADRALAREPGRAEALRVRADALAKLGRVDDAYETYRRRLLADGNDEAARSWLLEELNRRGMNALTAGAPLADALRRMDELVWVLGPEGSKPGIHLVYSRLLRKAGRLDEAIAALLKEIARQPEGGAPGELKQLLGELYLEDGQPAQALAAFADAESAGVSSVVFLRAYARLLDKVGQTEEAAQRYEKIISQAAYDREAHLALADRARRAQDAERERTHLEALVQADPKDMETLLRLAQSYALASDYAKSAKAYRILTMANPSNRALYEQPFADALFRSDDASAAAKIYRERVARGAPLEAAEWARLGDDESARGRLPDAHQAYERALEAHPSNTELVGRLTGLLEQRAGAELAARKFAQARLSAEKMIKLAPNRPEPWLWMGRIHLEENQLNPAFENFNQARAAAPDDVRPLIELARVERKRGRPLAAVDYLQKALALDAAEPVALAAIGDAWRQSGDVAKAFAAYKRAIDTADGADARIGMGDLFYDGGKYQVSLEQYQAAVKIAPDDPRPPARLARTLLHLGFREKAAQEAMRSLAIDSFAGGIDVLADVRLAQGDLDGARGLLESALSDQPGNPDWLFRLGEIYRRKNDGSKAKSLLAAALAGAKDNEQAYHIQIALGQARHAAGDLIDAASAFNRALALFPRRSAPHLNLAMVYRDRKDDLSAIAAVREAIQLDPESPQGYKLLGLLYYEAGQEEESLVAFRESLRRDGAQDDIKDLVKKIEEAQ